MTSHPESSSTDTASPGGEQIIWHTAASAHGGRAGHVEGEDAQLKVPLAVPQALGGHGGGGTTPEALYAAAHAASFQSAIGTAARREEYPEFGTSSVRCVVGLSRADGEDSALTLHPALEVRLPGLERGQAQRLVDAARAVCPFTRALEGGGLSVTLLEPQG